MLFSTPPADFNSKFNIVGCYVEYDGNIVILKRQSHKPQGNQYGPPAGKVDAGENLHEAMSRELKEETGISVSPDKLILIKSFPTRYPDYDCIFHAFKTTVMDKPAVMINHSEHIHYLWVEPKEILQLPDVMEGFADYTKTMYNL